MADTITLRGMTWDHSRGFDPMVATSQQWAQHHPGVSIAWEKRSLQAFADRPIGAMAGQYDLMVIDHPHVGEAARQGTLLALDVPERADDLAALAAQSVGLSHPSYEFDGRQWALAIDAATPVSAYRPDLLEAAPKDWDAVVALARAGKAGFALRPINALMTFFGLARNMGYPVAEDPDRLIRHDDACHVLDLLAEITALIDPRCLSMDPIGVYEWMGRTQDAIAYSPFGYGYTNYSREGYCPFPLVFADAPGIAGNGPRGTVLGGTGIAVSSQTRHAELALEYAYFVAGSECQPGLYFAAGGQPGNAVAWDSDTCNAAARNFFRNTRATLESAWLRPRYDGYMRLQDAGGDIVHAFLRCEADMASTLDRLNAAYRESLT